jgi:hypothetical protein
LVAKKAAPRPKMVVRRPPSAGPARSGAVVKKAPAARPRSAAVA